MGNVQLNTGLAVWRDNLLDGLKKLNGAISSKTKSAIPVLQAVEITATAADIFLTATDMDIVITVTIPNESRFQGKLLVNYKSLVTFLKKSKANIIKLEQINEHHVNIQADKINYKIVAYDVDMFPQKPHIDYVKVTLTKEQFEKAMKNTLYAVSTSESRPVLTGVNVMYDKNGLKFTATDSHRLAQYELWDYTTDEALNIIPTGELLKKALKIIDKKCEHVTIGFSEYHTLIEFDDVSCLIKNIEGNYPDTSRLIPEDFKTEILINKKTTIENLELLKIVYEHERNSSVKMHVDADIQLIAEKPETKEKMTADIDFSNIDGEALLIGYNANYMLDTLKAMDADEVELQFNGALKPFILKGDEAATHLILPVRTF